MSTPASRLSLPSELILHITTYLPLSSILALRLTSLQLSNTLSSPIKDRRHRLFLHPLSINHAVDFLHNGGEWRDEVTEVILLGNGEPEMRTRKRDHYLERALDFRVWDATLSNQGREQGSVEGWLTVDEGYKALLSGLQNLPALNTLRYASSIREGGGLGFCGVSDESIWRHAKSRDTWQLSFGGEGQPSLRQALKTTWWGDADIFVALVETLGGKVQNMEILARMPAVDGFWSSCARDVSGNAIRRVKVTGPGQLGWSAFLDGLVAEMKNIKILEVDIKSIIDEESMRYRRNMRSAGQAILWEEEESYLHGRFDFTALGGLSQLHTFSMTTSTPTLYPYSTWLSDVEEFLEAHVGTLREVFLESILPFTADMQGLEGAGIYPEYDMEEGIKGVVTFMRNKMDLHKAVLRLPRLGCLPDCDGTNHDPCCSEYSVKDTFQRVEMLDRLAQSTGVELKYGWWDFAEHVVCSTTA